MSVSAHYSFSRSSRAPPALLPFFSSNDSTGTAARPPAVHGSGATLAPTIAFAAPHSAFAEESLIIHLPSCYHANGIVVSRPTTAPPLSSAALDTHASKLILKLLVGLLLLAPGIANAAFTHPAHWRLDSIEQTYAGASCFYPGPNLASVHQCTNTTLSALLNAHMKNYISIAYYDLDGGRVLGGASWADWETVVPPVGVCMSGAVDQVDDAYSTSCRFAVADNDHDSVSAHIEECIVIRPQLRVIDGCYSPPRRAWFRLDDPTSGILTIIGLLIALPSFFLGAYRCYCARRAQQLRLDDGQTLPLDPIGDGCPARQGQPPRGRRAL